MEKVHKMFAAEFSGRAVNANGRASSHTKVEKLSFTQFSSFGGPGFLELMLFEFFFARVEM
eukprot:2414230-Amphidinium_carterae.1